MAVGDAWMGGEENYHHCWRGTTFVKTAGMNAFCFWLIYSLFLNIVLYGNRVGGRENTSNKKSEQKWVTLKEKEMPMKLSFFFLFVVFFDVLPGCREATREE